MELREASWPVLDELVEHEVEERSADTRHRYGRAAAHLLAVLASDEIPGELGPDVVSAVPLLVEPGRWPHSIPVTRTYLILLARLVDRFGGDVHAEGAVRTARERLEEARIARPPDPNATRIPARLLRDPGE